MELHREARAVRHRRIRLGRRVADGRRTARDASRRARVPRRPRPRARRCDRDVEPARPPAPAVAAVHARRARHAAVPRSGGPVRLQPNGDLAGHKPWRERYRAEGRIHGKADSEVGQRWLEDHWSAKTPAGEVLCSLHDVFGGQANLALLEGTAPSTATRATARTRSSRSALATSGSHPLGSTRSIGHCSASWRPPPPTAASSRWARPPASTSPDLRVRGRRVTFRAAARPTRIPEGWMSVGCAPEGVPCRISRSHPR